MTNNNIKSLNQNITAIGDNKMRTPVIAGNWKMNTTIVEAKELVNEMRTELDLLENI
jgi:hypothetical protein